MTPEIVKKYLGTSLLPLSALIGCKARHMIYGDGFVDSVQNKNSVPILHIKFVAQDEGINQRKFPLTSIDSKYFKLFFIPQNIAEEIENTEINISHNKNNNDKLDKDFLDSTNRLAKFLSDYREGEVPRLTSDYIKKWVDQFGIVSRQERNQFIQGICSIFYKYYFPKNKIVSALEKFSFDCEIFSYSEVKFYHEVGFIKEQEYGSSLVEMKSILKEILKKNKKLDIEKCYGSRYLIYVDDCLFTGNRCQKTIQNYLSQVQTPNKCKLIIYHVAVHRLAALNLKQDIKKEIFQPDLDLEIETYHYQEIDNIRSADSKLEILWPKKNVYTTEVNNWVNNHLSEKNRINAFRSENQNNRSNIQNKQNEVVFPNREIRDIVEKHLLIQGVNIILHMQKIVPNTSEYIRPLGFDYFRNLGFGSLYSSYRNIPTNSPVAFWFDGESFGHPWRPLLKRKSGNSDCWWF
jgi:hypothetical protein